MAFIFSSTEAFTPTVAHMMPFLIGRLPGANGSAAKTPGPMAAVSVSATPPAFRNSRRVWVGFKIRGTVARVAYCMLRQAFDVRPAVALTHYTTRRTILDRLRKSRHLH